VVAVAAVASTLVIQGGAVPKKGSVLWLVDRLKSGTLAQGSVFPFGQPKPYSESSRKHADGTVYGVSVYTHLNDRIILLLYWTLSPKSNANTIVHSACLVSGGEGSREERWFFCDKELISRHVDVALEKNANQPSNN
jgi:hypothetical protein